MPILPVKADEFESRLNLVFGRSLPRYDRNVIRTSESTCMALVDFFFLNTQNIAKV